MSKFPDINVAALAQQIGYTGSMGELERFTALVLHEAATLSLERCEEVGHRRSNSGSFVERVACEAAGASVAHMFTKIANRITNANS